MDQNFESIFISIDYCNPKTYQGKCEDHDEIEKFLAKNLFSFINQKTMVDKNIYSKDDSDPFFMKHDNEYYPLQKKAERQFQHTLQPYKNDFIRMYEVYLGIDMVEFDDSYF